MGAQNTTLYILHVLCVCMGCGTMAENLVVPGEAPKVHGAGLGVLERLTRGMTVQGSGTHSLLLTSLL